MLNDRKGRIKVEADRLSELFVAAGALPVETDSLQSANILLDLYGEDIRARAFVTHDPTSGEQMLRPDFTVPVVQMHMNEGAEPARYTYNGPVWRKQTPGSERASEYVQVGFELFDRHNPAASDAEVFSLFAQVLAPIGLRAVTGDMGILRAAVNGLSTLERRKAALMRHLWRPTRFRQLLERYAGLTEVPASRATLLENAKDTPTDRLIEKAGVDVGLRRQDEISDRVTALMEDAGAPKISKTEVQILEEILSLSEKSSDALKTLRGFESVIAGLQPAVDQLERRLTALADLGVDVDALDFEASYGRTTMEYYDGFVFGFYAEGRPDLPVVASGGRYDALTGVLGQGRSIPAVGAVIRPETVLAVKEGLS